MPQIEGRVDVTSYQREPGSDDQLDPEVWAHLNELPDPDDVERDGYTDDPDDSDQD